MNDHDFSFQIGQNTRDVRVRFAGFPDEGNNSNNSQSNHTHSGKLNSGSRLRNNHNSLSNNVNNGGIFLHKVDMKHLVAFLYTETIFNLGSESIIINFGIIF